MPEIFPEPNRREALKWMAAGAVTSLAAISRASVATGEIVVERRELQLPLWDADGFRVAVAADLHTNSPMEVEHARHALRLAIAENPDLIVLPGDFVNYGDDDSLRYVVDSLEPLHDARCPVLGSLGNHDYSSGNVMGVVRSLKSSSATVLINESRDVSGVSVFGFDDAMSTNHDSDAILRGNYSKSLLTLLHEPDYVDAVPLFVSLQISGHSHGGQICLPGGVPIHTPEGAVKYFSGFYPKARVPLYVTRGVGTVGPRLRMFCPPEVSVLTLRSSA